MKTQRTHSSTAIITAIMISMFVAATAFGMEIQFQYRLANFDGIVSSLWARLALDKETTELYALDRHEREVRIFNEAAMEVFAIGEDVELAGADDIALGEEGTLYVVYGNSPEHTVLKLNYKGEEVGHLRLSGVPEELMPFHPDHVEYLDNRLYLADSNDLSIIIVEADGRFLKGYRLPALLQQNAEKLALNVEDGQLKDDRQIPASFGGFCVDQQGAMYFTVPAMFAAFRLSADGELQGFGQPGSAAGKFGVVGGIGTDGAGNLYIADRLRCVVLIFDRNFTFLKEFGYRGSRPGSLIVPDDVVVDDARGTVYVSQAANRGVSVYKLIFN
ncbi:MAG: hypothetical protein JXO49_01470 [Deltaproteobacteria bacterium]|nr:hypothetical protein [Candidatus Anaeroferrophillus wilburensis]MBN2887997.1 hypothetical protein [Deltaproteobacteria bacterium]